MKVIDMHWMDDERWFYFDGLIPRIREDAPEDVKQSFENYKEQIKSKSA